LKGPLFKRPTPETKFHIDYEWWEQSNLDLKTYLFSRLQIGDDLPYDPGVEKVDLVDPDTGEVRRVDNFQYALQNYFSQLPPDFLRQSALVDAVFCLLLANANQPMSARQIAEKVQRPADVILKTLAGGKIYQGIRPIFADEEAA
jgi:hypothetical protein